jgi:membrane protein involved in colicin uptake
VERKKQAKELERLKKEREQQQSKAEEEKKRLEAAKAIQLQQDPSWPKAHKVTFILLFHVILLVQSIIPCSSY